MNIGAVWSTIHDSNPALQTTACGQIMVYVFLPFQVWRHDLPPVLQMQLQARYVAPDVCCPWRIWLHVEVGECEEDDGNGGVDVVVHVAELDG
jgi:hypothetical protein